MNRVLFVCLLPALSGCIKAPELVLVDRPTALEQQAAGSFDELDKRLARATSAPQPVALTPDQLETLGLSTPVLADASEKTEADQVDDLLRQHCIGEGKDGLLVSTHDACRGATDRARTTTLVDRTNTARQQLWRWMRERKPKASQEEIRRAWQVSHRRGIVCGGWLQRDDGTWEDKTC